MDDRRPAAAAFHETERSTDSSMQGMAIGRWVFSSPQLAQRELIDRIVEWSHTARREDLLAHVSRLSLMREMYIDGLISIANGDNPRIIESRLQGYIV